ncbi:MAG: histidine kinase [Verrucomicrobiota bacterium]
MGNFGPGPGPLMMGGGPMFASGGTSWREELRRAVFSLQFSAPIYWWIVCGCWALSHFQESRERERRALELEARLNEANLQALKMQLQPHFLFNTLNAIATLVHENPQAADDMIGSLSQFLRMCLDVSAQNEVPLQKELEFVNRYLDIQQTRFGGRLRVEREIDPRAEGAMVPPLLLQPLVENSIRHGFETRESGGVVTIRIQRREEMLRLEVCDDGGGFTGRELLARSEGIGLSNTKARLQALYGERHEFRLIANRPTGVCVHIEIPFRTKEAPAGHQP